jgi:hypothetical protein
VAFESNGLELCTRRRSWGLVLPHQARQCTTNRQDVYKKRMSLVTMETLVAAASVGLAVFHLAPRLRSRCYRRWWGDASPVKEYQGFSVVVPFPCFLASHRWRAGVGYPWHVVKLWWTIKVHRVRLDQILVLNNHLPVDHRHHASVSRFYTHASQQQYC